MLGTSKGFYLFLPGGSLAIRANIDDGGNGRSGSLGLGDAVLGHVEVNAWEFLAFLDGLPRVGHGHWIGIRGLGRRIV